MGFQVAMGQVFLRNLSFALPVLFHQCPILINSFTSDAVLSYELTAWLKHT